MEKMEEESVWKSKDEARVTKLQQIAKRPPTSRAAPDTAGHQQHKRESKVVYISKMDRRKDGDYLAREKTVIAYETPHSFYTARQREIV